MSKRPPFFYLLIFAWLGCLAACQGQTPPTPVPLPSRAAITPAGVQPTPTLLPPPVVAAPTVTLAPAPLPAASPTPLPAPAATPNQPLPGQIGPDNFPAGVNPLTGETLADPAALQRRPLAIKVSNYPPLVRPQAGLSAADLVFEHYAEGGVTRFTAVFYGHDADLVGSVRSGRLIDLEIPKMYDAAFAYSGASGPVRLLFRDSPFFDRIISPDFGHDGFYRRPDPNKAFEHTLFTDTLFLRNILTNRGLNTPPDFQNGMTFAPDSPPGGQPAGTLQFNYSATTAFWQYNPATQRYARWADGQAQLDANTGQQLAFRNVIAVAANHVETLMVEDSLGSRSIEIQIWGEGPVSIFRDGLRFDGHWVRSNPYDMLTFYDANNQVIPLAVGNSFFQVIPLGSNDLIVTP